MLKKLIKHEFKATGRFFLPAFGVFAAMLVLQRLSMHFLVNETGKDTIFGILASFFVNMVSTITVVGLIALLVAPLVYAVVRFYRNMLCDEGYLSFTLPVTTAQHLWSKTLAASVWQLVTMLVVALGGILYFLSVDSAEVKAFFYQLGEFFSIMYADGGGWSILLAVLVVLTILSQHPATFLTVYSAMSIGQCANKNKMLASVGVYAAYNIATTIFIQVIAVIVSVCVFQWNGPISAYFSAQPTAAMQIACIVAAALLLLNVLMIVLHFLLGRHFLTKKLNLA